MECKFSSLENMRVSYNSNPSIWIRTDFDINKKFGCAVAPTKVYVNKNGDIVIEVIEEDL